jgi:hypothetical protein
MKYQALLMGKIVVNHDLGVIDVQTNPNVETVGIKASNECLDWWHITLESQRNTKSRWKLAQYRGIYNVYMYSFYD